MKLFTKVAIVGTGLIGGSIGLSIKKIGLARQVVGVSRHKESLFIAKKMRAIDAGSQSLEIIKGADLLLLATPVELISKLALQISKLVSKDCLVSDVGSTKQEITSGLDKIFPNFVGAHPMAGSEKRGIANASADLFNGSLCIITPTKKTNKAALGQLKLFWRELGARVVLLDPQSHDKILGFTSHLPHAAAFALMNTLPRQFMKFSAGGLRDMTRIAASDSRLWSGIFLSNRKNILPAIALLQKNLSALVSAVKNKDRKLLGEILKQAKIKRGSLIGTQKSLVF
ncbi:MAG: prephenate dehydrogenase [Candidatus Omnitrophota bacterium]